MKKISDVIKELEELKQEHGDLIMYVSSDAEGNDSSPYDEATYSIVDSEGNSWHEVDVEREIELGEYPEDEFVHVAKLWRV